MIREVFSHILVPHDFTAPADQALRAAAAFAASAGGSITVLHVITPFYPLSNVTYPGPGLLDAQTLEGRVRDRLQAHVAPLVGPNGATCRVVTGNPGTRIVDAARDASCVVMPTHGRTGATRALMGSVAERVVRLSPVPVLVLPPARRPRSRPSRRAARKR